MKLFEGFDYFEKKNPTHSHKYYDSESERGFGANIQFTKNYLKFWINI